MSATLYRLRDAAGDLLYVGATLDAAARLAELADSQEWWPDVARVDLDAQPSLAAARAAEADVIATERPVHLPVRYGGPVAGDRYSAADLDDLGQALRTTRTDLYAAVVTAVQVDGITETEAANRSGLNRSTVRTILGKA